MSKEKEIQDELERYWGQLDRVEKFLRWLVIYNKHHDPGEYLRAKNNARIRGVEFPDISDILEGK